MRHTKIFIATLSLCFTTSSFAMLCPSNFSTINVGDTLEQVKTACGDPTSETTKESLDDASQEWVYYFTPDPSQSGIVPTQPQTATLRTTVALVNGKVVNISTNGMGMTSTLCGGQVQIGTPAAKVKSACGKPAMINTSDNGQKNGGGVKITELVYTTPANTTTLTFKNGVLLDRNQ